MKKIIKIGMMMALFFAFTPIAISAEANEHLEDEVIYDIVVDRFNNMNQENSEKVDVDDPYAYHGGDLQGITVKLDELKSLGFTTISLSPVMENADNGFHGYWIEDHFKVENEFGTMEDLQELIDKAHEREMKVILEFVPNYIAASHPITTDNKAWIDESEKIDKEVAPWLEEAVALNQELPEVQNYLKEVADYWIDETEIDGFKIHEVDKAEPSFLENFTGHLKEKNPEFILIGTLSEASVEMNEKAMAGLDFVENNKLQEVMAHVFANEDEPVSRIYTTWEEAGKQPGLISIDDKFKKRFTHQFTEEGRNLVTAWKLALTYIYTTPGVPFIYQGSEIPMYGEKYPETQVLMQFNSGEPELKEYYTRISSLREQFSALRLGDFEVVATDQGMSVFKRSYKDETVYVAINNDTESRVVELTDIDSNVQLRGVLEDNLVRENKNGEYKIGIPRESSEVYVVEDETGLNWIFILPMVVVFVLFVAAVIYLSRKQKQINQQETK